MYRKKIAEKFNDALSAVLPMVAIVLALSLTVAPMGTDLMLVFLAGSALLVVGMMLFTQGSELAMEPMGNSIGSQLTKSRQLWLVIPVAFLLGVMITVSEPDLQVLANQVESIPNSVLILSVGAGVGLFLVIAVLRMLFNISFRVLLIVFYAIVIALSFFVPENYLAVAFDSGGVTTGPMTVPFIMTFGIGICSIRSDKKAADDSFGLVAICSIGPILAVLILSILYSGDTANYSAAALPSAGTTSELGALFLRELPLYTKEVALALLPIVVFFGIFRTFSLKLDKKTMRRTVIGLVYTFAGLVIFLTGVNVGFMPVGSFMGAALSSIGGGWVIIPMGMLMGFFIVRAEPAVYVLMKQVEEITNGAISGRMLRDSLSVGVSVSVGLSMLRVLTGINIMYFVIPGYAIALIMSFFVPPIFTAVAFDSGGVASGPMTAAFLLPFSVGACMAVGGNVVTDAFGVVAMVAMTPLITIQILGVSYRIGASRRVSEQDYSDVFAELDNYSIIEL